MANNYINEAVKNSYYVLVLSLLGVVIGYLLRVFLSRALSIEDFGLFYAVSAFVGLLTLVRYLGLNQALAKFIPEFLISNDRNRIKSSITIVLIVQTITILVFTALVVIFQDALSLALFKSDRASWVIILMTLSFLPSMVFMIFQSVFQGYQRLKLYAWIEPIRISVTFMSSMLLSSMGALGIALAYLVTSIVTSLIFLPSFLKLGILKEKSSVTSELFFRLFRFGGPVFLSSVGFIVINFTDTLVITYFRSLEEVALYQVALPTSQLLIVFSSAIAAVIFPLVSYLYSSKKYADIGKGLKVIISMMLVVLIPFVIVLFTFPDIILRLLFSSQFIPAANALQVLSVGMIFYSIFFVLQTVLDGIGRPFINTKIMFLMAIVNIVLNIMLVPVLGIVGSATAFLISFLVGSLIEYRYVRKYLPMTLPLGRLSKITLGAIISIACIFAAKAYLQAPTIGNFVVSLAIGWLVYFVIAIATKAVTSEDVEVVASFMPLPAFAKKTSKKLFREKGKKRK